MKYRAALLPIYGEMFHTVGLWMQQYQRWQDRVDKLVVDHNNMSHGNSIREMVIGTKHEYLLLIEQDAVILDPDFLDKCFKMVESGEVDFVGSPRMSCHPQIAKAAKDKWDLNYEGFGDKGPNFWPNFFICKRSDLLKTDLHFEAKSWRVGDHISELDYTVVDENISGDTFVWASIQLRAMGLKYHEVPQYHASPYDIENHRKKEGLWDGKCPWFHFGSITGDFSPPTTDMEKRELERRASWHELAGESMSQVATKFGLNKSRIEQFKEIYRELMYVKVH